MILGVVAEIQVVLSRAVDVQFFWAFFFGKFVTMDTFCSSCGKFFGFFFLGGEQLMTGFFP